MNSEVSEKAASRQLRRSTRQSLSANAKAVNFEPTPRGPLKRTKKSSKSPPEVPSSNGTNNNDSDEEGVPNKKTRLQTSDNLSSGHGSAPPKDVLEPMETQNESIGLEGHVKTPIQYPPLSHNPPGPFGDVNLKPLVVLGQRCPVSHPESENVIKSQVAQPKKNAVSPSKSTQIPPKRTSDACCVTVTSMADYKRKMEAKITENPKVNHYVTNNYPVSVTTTRQRTVSTPKSSVPERKTEKKKTTVSPQSSHVPSKGFLRYLWQLILLMLLSAGIFLSFKHLHTLQRTKDGSAPSSRSVNSGLFVEEMSQVAMRFPVQHTELWRRSQIHLQKHLDTPHPTEPVSLVLTAGLKAKKTLHCLALNIASAFSSAVNTSVVVIDGESQANLDSDQVKMNIDSQLKEAFGSDKLAAVVHRFELLPPGSTLIFYRYCDHETAAYKRAFLLFTVLLSVEDLSTQQSLKEVEEMVRDHVEERFVGNETAFNEMDADKFSGLWSRIAHLILPVVYENETEQRGC
ncbi:torsin-1A-interacting protein 2-like isoform X2 [Periophthalmus magnuspinnatus]|uniref:torsin-1A-interacting protein 2-like isoform X2 n=1 Tax=Periophthalmus magnuspinnatus TaxID=409849 RepID=UPI0024365F12|nr:torsin-1A-interacting protein 2-like isoform X2 [Periophthalmus magnuspinnatus]